MLGARVTAGEHVWRCPCRRALGTHSGHEGQTGCSQAPAKLNLTPEQIKRGLQYRAHVLSAMEKWAPHPPWDSSLGIGKLDS